MREERWVAAFAGLARAPAQRNEPWEADAELLEVGGQLLALTVDTLSEELALFHDPATMGWLAVLASIADLAAVGARPEGLLLSLELPLAAWEGRRARLVDGVRGALDAHGSHLLGGDTNDTPHLALTTVGVGRVEGAALRRSGARPGDALYVVGELGLANLVALDAQAGGGPSPQEAALRRPLPLGPWLASREGVSACTDSSDGLLAACAHLARASGVGFEIETAGLPYAPEVARRADRLGLPRLAFAAAGVGEHALVFTVPAASEAAWVSRARKGGLEPARVGTALDRPDLHLRGDDLRARWLRPEDALAVAALRRPEDILEALAGW